MPQDSMQLALRNGEGHVVGELLVANLPGRQDTTFSARGDVALREAGDLPLRNIDRRNECRS